MAGLARWSLRLVLAFWLFVACTWGVLHGWIVPRIGEWRPELQALASRKLGASVHIGSITAQSQGLLPSFELADVSLQDPQRGTQALHLPRVLVSLSMRSLLRLGVEQIYLDRPELTIRRTTDGRIFVAGLEVSASEGEHNPTADWIFSQTELALGGGRLSWLDEMRQAPVLTLESVDLALRNKGRGHALRLDATPPAEWGQRFTLMGRFRQPLLTTHGGSWRRWNGQAYASFSEVDLSRLGRYLDLQDLSLQQGRGAVRAWLDLRQGQPVGATADLAVQALQLQWKSNPRPLHLQALKGRLAAQRKNGYRISARGLEFSTGDGLDWPSSNFSASYTPSGASAQGALGEHGEIHSDQLDLAMAAQLMQRLPLAPELRQRLSALAPGGRLDQLQLSWRGPWRHPAQYQASGRLSRFAINSQPSEQGPRTPGIPGARGLDLQFSLDQNGGQAQLGIDEAGPPARLSFPGVFEEPDIELHRLQASARWQLQGSSIRVQVPSLRFANKDTEGEARAEWHTGQGKAGQPRFPGVLDLQGQLGETDGTRVHRYLPLEIDADVRRYVRTAIKSGRANGVSFKVRGDLEQMPFEKPGQGEFRIAAKLHDVEYDYVPAHLREPGEKPWPALTRLSGELVFDKASMGVRQARARFADQPQLALQDIQASIADLSHSEVEVSAKVQGPLDHMLTVVQQSSLSQLTSHVLDQSRATGQAQLGLQLKLPIEHMEQARVSGQVALAGNTLQLNADTPGLSQLRGSVQFSEQGFSLSGLRARALGGELRAEGGMRALAAKAAPQESALQITIHGQASAQGLREAHELGWITELARHASGQAAYSLQIAEHRGQPSLLVQSSLQGLAIELPAPLGKSAETALPLSYSHTLTSQALASAQAPLHDRIDVRLDKLGRVVYERDLEAGQPRVLRGSIQLGPEDASSPYLPERGVHAQLQWPSLVLEDWQDLLPDASPPGSGQAPSAQSWRGYLPSSFALRLGQLQAKGRQLHDVVAGISRDGSSWHGNVSARELDGHVEYREASRTDPAGRFSGKFSRLNLPENRSERIAAWLNHGPRALPALQIDIEKLQLAGRPLGRLEVEARNQPVPGAPQTREWQLARFDITTPEALLTARGQWRLSSTQPDDPGRTDLQFELDLRDAGHLLTRFDMAGVLGKGKGSLQGAASWTGSPITPDWRSLSGKMHLDVQNGQFLKADPGLAKLLGVLSLQALPRRLTLDFRDVFSNGFAFDFLRGDAQISQGIARTNNLQMKGVNAAVLMEGSADLDKETQSLHVVVVPEINAMTASLVATAINPVIGLGSFLAQVLLRGPLIAANTKEFRIDGSWSDPQVTALPRRKLPAEPDPPSAPTQGEKP